MNKKLLTMAVIAMACLSLNAQNKMENKIVKENLILTEKWDKVFPQSKKVDHSKVTFVNRYGITLAADMYIPKDAKSKLPAIAVAGPFGAVNEQSSGLYAQGYYEQGGGVVDAEHINQDTPWFVKDNHDYYKTKRGYHERSVNSNDGGGKNAIPFDYIEEFLKEYLK